MHRKERNSVATHSSCYWKTVRFLGLGIHGSSCAMMREELCMGEKRPYPTQIWRSMAYFAGVKAIQSESSVLAIGWIKYSAVGGSLTDCVLTDCHCQTDIYLFGYDTTIFSWNFQLQLTPWLIKLLSAFIDDVHAIIVSFSVKNIPKYQKFRIHFTNLWLLGHCDRSSRGIRLEPAALWS